MAKTGESYTAARRKVITEFQAAGGNGLAGEPERFAISYDDMGPISTWADTLLGGGPAGGRIEVRTSDEGNDRRACQGRQLAGERLG
jgi:hypothetical protein